MTNTAHFTLRCKQRCISSVEIQMALLFGTHTQDKDVLGAKNCESLLRAVSSWEQKLRNGCQNAGVSLAKGN